jgi:recombination protein RecT
MSNLATIQPQQSRAPSKVEVFMARVLTPEDRSAIKSALPAHIPFARFERNLSNALMNEPRLLECNPREVFREVAKIAALGLLIDSQLGEAYLIASRTGPQARVGYRGLIKLARQSGDVSMLYAHEVYSNDEIECLLGDEKKLRHKPNLFGDRGEIIGYYAVVKFKDGDTDFEPMTPQQIDKIRDKSDGYKAFKAGKIKDTPWASSYDEMAKKTCIRRLAKRIPQSPDLAAALSIEDKAEFLELQATQATISTSAAPSSLSDRLDALAAPREPAPAHDAETGEIIDDTGAEDVSADAPANGPAVAPKGAEDAQPRQNAQKAAAATTASAGSAAADIEEDTRTDEELLLDEAREHAVEGKRVLDRWYNGLSADNLDRINPHMPELWKAARAVDEAAKSAPAQIDREAILAEARSNAMDGVKAFNSWFQALSAAQQEALQGHMRALLDAAKQADGRA